MGLGRSNLISQWSLLALVNGRGSVPDVVPKYVVMTADCSDSLETYESEWISCPPYLLICPNSLIFPELTCPAFPSHLQLELSILRCPTINHKFPDSRFPAACSHPALFPEAPRAKLELEANLLRAKEPW